MKNIIQNVLSPFGVRLIRTSTIRQFETMIQQSQQGQSTWLVNKKIKTILDIGANTGQFAQRIHSIFPDAMLYSFEPLEDCYNELVSNFQDVKNFQAFNVALSDESGFVEMRRNEYSMSSSLLPMKDLHKECFPFTEKETIQEIKVVCLDDISRQLKLEEPTLIKLDVQGFEDRVIAGGKEVISRASVILIEMSVELLYENQPLFDDIYRTLFDLGFRYKGNYDQLSNPHDGSILQVDGIFIKA